MKLNIKGCRAFCERNEIKNYEELSDVLELSVEVIMLLEQGRQIGYDAVKDIYNKLGESAVLQIINFEGETLNGFKSKYILVGTAIKAIKGTPVYTPPKSSNSSKPSGNGNGSGSDKGDK